MSARLRLPLVQALIKGTKWGVLVLDSRRPDGISPGKQHLVTALAGALSKML